MKTVLFALIAISLLSCKKDAQRALAIKRHVATFKFNPTGHLSTMSVTDEQTGYVQSFTQADTITMSSSVSEGDTFIAEMAGSADGLDTHYKIIVSCDGQIVGEDRATGITGVHEQDIKLPITFVGENFK